MIIAVKTIGDIFKPVIDSVEGEAKISLVDFTPGGLLAFLEPSVSYFQRKPIPASVDTDGIDYAVRPIVQKFKGRSKVHGNEVSREIQQAVCH